MSEQKPQGLFRREICKIISRMLDNPDDIGIYPTGVCFEELDALVADVEKERDNGWYWLIEGEIQRAGFDTTGLAGMALIREVMAGKLSRRAEEKPGE